MKEIFLFKQNQFCFDIFQKMKYFQNLIKCDQIYLIIYVIFNCCKYHYDYLVIIYCK